MACVVQLKVEAEEAIVAERRQALEAERVAKQQEFKQRAEVARQRVLEQVTIIELGSSLRKDVC